MEPEEGVLEFEGDLLLPNINFRAYREIYALECWLRRICLAAWMSQCGSAWLSQLGDDLRKRLASRVKGQKRRRYLGAESDDEYIWATTHHELVTLLSSPTLGTAVEELTGAPALFISQKLDEVREIRNLLAHNRALTTRTYRILSGLTASLEDAVETFRERIFYSMGDIEPAEDPLTELYTELMVDNDWSNYQAFIAHSQYGNLMEFVCLPAGQNENNGEWPSAASLLRHFHNSRSEIVAFALNQLGCEFIVLTPRLLDQSTQEGILRSFLGCRDVWCDTPFEQQDPRSICHPKMWIYPNSNPAEHRR